MSKRNLKKLKKVLDNTTHGPVTTITTPQNKDGTQDPPYENRPRLGTVTVVK